MGSEYNDLVHHVASNWTSDGVRSVSSISEALGSLANSMEVLVQCIKCGTSAEVLVGQGYCRECTSSMKAPPPPSRVAAAAAIDNLKAKSNKSTQDLIRQVCDEIKDTLVEKNKAYGDSALDPVRIFSSASSEEQLRVRIDDKLSRMARGSAAGEDVELDLIGYLVLLRVHRVRNREGR